jgi:glyoxylase-like metal-dependent hydrolase (beta-lactamase superfamily II)
MLHPEPGKINEHLYLLGRLESCVAWVTDGTRSAILGGSMGYVVPDILRQAEAFGLDPRTLERLVILHAHFDHCGIAPALKQRWPWIRISGSRRAQQLLADPKVVAGITALNAAALVRAEVPETYGDLSLGFAPVAVDEVLGDGDRFPVGSLDLEVLEVPGHSSCSIAAYLPAERTLFPSDAGGIRFRGYHLSSGNANFDQYQASLEKLSRLDVDLLVQEHYGALTGDDARAFLPTSIAEARRTRGIIEDIVRATPDVDQAAEQVTDAFMVGAPEDFLPREVLALVAGQMVRWFRKRLPA